MRIECHTLVKDYQQLRAVNRVSFTAESGAITALLGPNGAGKSSLMRMLIGLTRPDQGQIRVDWQQQAYHALPRSAFAYLPEDRGLYQDRTVEQNLTYIAKLRGLSADEQPNQVRYWLERLQLGDKIKTKLSELSKGNQQKVQLCSCLLGEPDCLILDEPFSGLDPVNQELVVALLQEYRDRGKLILLSAHQMALVERLADRLVLLQQGQSLAQGTLAQVRAQLGDRQQLRIDYLQPPEPQAWLDFQQRQPQAQQDNRCVNLTLEPQTDLNQLLLQLLKLGQISQWQLQQSSLHQLYLNAVTPSEAI